MRLVTFVSSSGKPKAGALIARDERIVDLQAAHRLRFGGSSKHLASVLAIAEGGANALDIASQTAKGAQSKAADAIVRRKDVKLLAPIPQPPQMRDFLCFEKHLIQAFQATRKVRASATADPEAAMRDMEAKGILAIPQAWYEQPLFYKPSRLSVVGPDTDVDWPSYSERLDYELEFGFYIGKPGKDIPRERAHEHIFGYTIFNDISARDQQAKEMPGQLGPGKSKDFDGSNVMGPCVVTADEIPDPNSLEMCVRVNGKEHGRGNSRDMRWKFEDLIAHVSRSETLFSGEFFGSGTVGDGCGLEHMRFLEPNDVIELEVERIGVLRTRVVRR